MVFIWDTLSSLTLSGAAAASGCIKNKNVMIRAFTIDSFQLLQKKLLGLYIQWLISSGNRAIAFDARGSLIPILRNAKLQTLGPLR